MNIQSEAMKIHSRYGMSEMANYKLQLLAEQYAKEYHESKKEEQQRTWISVKDRLPDNDRPVLVAMRDWFGRPRKCVCFYNFNTRDWVGHPMEKMRNIAHWQELPSDPLSTSSNTKGQTLQ